MKSLPELAAEQLGIDSDEARAAFDERLALERVGALTPISCISNEEDHALAIGVLAAKRRNPTPEASELHALASLFTVKSITWLGGDPFPVLAPPHDLPVGLDPMFVERAKGIAWMDARARARETKGEQR